MIYCFDLDGTICDTNSSDYANSVPKVDVIKRVNRLSQDGHTIKIFTGRGATSGIDWRKFTEGQLKNWGLKYHELIMGKPHADIFIDDRGMNIKDFVSGESLL